MTLNPGKATPEKIIPFTVPLEEFKKSVIKYLTEGEYTPADIFDQVEFISTKGVYIPLYYFDTSYAVKYVAEIGYNRTETYLDYGFGSERNKLVKKRGLLPIGVRIAILWRVLVLLMLSVHQCSTNSM